MHQVNVANGEGMIEHGTSIATGSTVGSDSLPDPLMEFQFDGEMGPVADISTFPPTMAPHSDDHMGMLSIDTILSTSFWDNVLVPGKSVADSTHHRSHSL